MLFLADLLVTMFRWKLVGDLAFVVHHITSAVAFLYVIVSVVIICIPKSELWFDGITT